jgi:hypothetical protein
VSLLPADEINFVDLVGEAFLAVRGTGLVLSPVDVELLRGYEAAAIPAPLLIRTIFLAAERRRDHGKPPPASLSSIRRSLDAAARRFQAGQARAVEPVSAATLDRLLASAREGEAPEERAAYRAAYRAACAGQPVVEAGALGWLAALPRTRQRQVSTSIRTTLGPRLAPEPLEEYRQRLRGALIAGALDRAELHF